MGEIVKVNAGELKSFGDKMFAPNVVYQSAGMKVVLAYFKTGQFIPVHTPGVDLVLYILEGEAEVVTGDERLTARKDDLIIVPKGLKRGIKALTELTILHVVQPPPSEEDHNQVHTRLAEGRFE
ncbi:MAG: cupin domain-containing protein [Desulfobacterales bacterium]|jgi:quercetin dioxygenase-like cupin family protein|nr:cupin domain-containing protein [Desulfobacterales bacterium]